MKTCEIVTREKTVCGAAVRYSLTKLAEESYEIKIIGHSEASAVFDGDFFEIVDLFKTMIITDTLPENLFDIHQDFKNFALA